MTQYNAACGCGAVQFSLNAEPLNVVNCHCNMCKNHNGSSFSTYAIFPADCLSLSTGQEAITRYSANDGEKHFCKLCGTPLFNMHEKYQGVRMVYLGALHTIGDIAPKINVWTENSLSWVNDIENIPSKPQG